MGSHSRGVEAVRVRRGSELDNVLCDGIEDLLDPTGASSINHGRRVVSVNIEDTAACGGGGEADAHSQSYGSGRGRAAAPYPASPGRTWWSDPHEDDSSLSIRPEDIVVDPALTQGGLLNPAAMLKRLQEERDAEDKRVEDAKRAKLSAVQRELTARAMEGAKLKKRYATSNSRSEELARRRLEVTLEMEVEQRKIAWEDKQRELKLLAGLVKPPLHHHQHHLTSADLPAAVPHSPKRVRVGVAVPASAPCRPATAAGNAGTDHVSPRKGGGGERPISCHVPPGLEAMLPAPSSPRSSGASSSSGPAVRSSAGGSLRRGGAGIYKVAEPTAFRAHSGTSPRHPPPASPPSRPTTGSSSMSPRGGLSTMGVRLPHVSL